MNFSRLQSIMTECLRIVTDKDALDGLRYTRPLNKDELRKIVNEDEIAHLVKEGFLEECLDHYQITAKGVNYAL